jgi:mannitol-specific phosphotransferase system IIBC component
MIENPFESGHIKNYLLLYASIVVIMILFFIASTLFLDIEQYETKEFNTEVNQTQLDLQTEQTNTTLKEEKHTKYKLLDTNLSY